MIRFPFNERKTTQAAAHLLKFCGGELPCISLVKILYLADRRALIEIGQPITGDAAVSMPHGPVLSQVFEFISIGKEPERAAPGKYWFDVISAPSNYTVRLQKNKLQDDELSDYEMEVLRQTAETYGKLDRWDLVRFTHTLPEWVDPRGSAVPIEPEAILRAAGKPTEEIERIAAEAETLLFLSQLGSGFG